MRKAVFSLLFAAVMALGAQNIDLGTIKWIAPRGQEKSNSYEIKGQEISLKLGAEEGKGAWFVGNLQEAVSLTGNNYLNFAAKSDDGKTHSVNFFIRRELEPGNEATFYSILEITPEWKTFNLQLTRGDRSKAANGLFAFTKGSKNCDIELSRGGKLLTLQPAGRGTVQITFKDFSLSPDKMVNNPKAEAMKAEIAGHARIQPYQFKEVIRKDAVKAAGFSIQLATNASETEKFAAGELAKYLGKATGVEFPVGEQASAKAISLSVQPGSPDEAFAMELTDGKNLKITGNSPRALLYAVYDFLEKAAGVRWFAPFDYGEVVPANPDLMFPLFKDENAPLMSYRCSHYCSYGRHADSREHRYKMADWAFKNKFNVELERLEDREKINAFYALRGGCIWLMENAGHNFHVLISPKKFFASNPEFFCYERSTGKWRAERAQLCTTNPELVKEIGKIADVYFERHPDHQYFPLFQEDGHRLWCQCDACLALNPTGENLSYATENNINLANNVLEEIRRRHPGKGVFTYAYGVTTRPPVNILPKPGIRIMYCFYSDGNPGQPPWSGKAFEEISQWSKLTDGNIVIYSYHYMNPRYLFNNDRVLTDMFRMFNIMHIQGSNQETAESWGGLDGFQLYQGGRLAWNPWFDEEALKQDYFDKFYGAGGEFIRRYHELLSRTLSDKSKWKRMGLGRYASVPPAELAEMEKLIKSAAAAVGNDERAAKAVQTQADYLEYIRAFSKVMDAGDAFYRSPSEEGYQAAMKAIGEVRAVVKKLVPPRVVSYYVTRLFDAWERSLKNTRKENLALQSVLKDYKQLKVITEDWKFKTDPDARGDKEKWFAADFADAEWAALKSGKFWEDQGFPNYDGSAWYRITIEVPPGKPAALYFGGADERAWVYLDGQYIGGHHEGDVGVLWDEPFTVDLPEGTTPGAHQLTVKVIDSAGKGGLWKDVYLVQKK